MYYDCVHGHEPRRNVLKDNMSTLETAHILFTVLGLIATIQRIMHAGHDGLRPQLLPLWPWTRPVQMQQDGQAPCFLKSVSMQDDTFTYLCLYLHLA